MKKSYGYIITVLIVSFALIIMNLIAYYDDGTPGNPGGTGTEPLVNTFDPGYLDPPPPTPPIGPEEDHAKWQYHGDPTPVAQATRFSGDINTNSHGVNYLKAVWSADYQYLLLPSQYFENVGCTGGVTSTPDPATYDPADAPNWECYDYIEFDIFMNEGINGSTNFASQKASIIDSSGVTFTSFDLPIMAQSDNVWKYRVSMSLNYIANQYYEEKGDYFSVDDIGAFVINAPETTQYDISEYVMYYDHLTLGAGIDPNAPSEVSMLEAFPTPNEVKMEIEWNDSAGGGTCPISGYHIYRAIGGDGPYEHLDFCTRTQNTYTDYNITVGDTDYCYKVLAMDNGPGTLSDSGTMVTNTINATYNEARLYEATPMCEYMPELPTSTPTPYEGTAGPTPTVTPVPEGEEIDARVYPNPFNPNDGSGNFYTDNVPDDSKISIYAMDGSLVEDGTIEGSQRFVWDGKNKNGSKVVSGLYYLVVEPPEDSEQKPKVYRIIVCYKCDTTYESEQ